MDHPVRKEGPRRDAEATRAALIGAAWQEFEERGFEAAQSNRIAQRAGYCPQTFYRHFTDKVDVLLAVYVEWVAEQQKALAGTCNMREAARVVLVGQRASIKFRGALSALALTNEKVRDIRARMRLHMVAYLRGFFTNVAGLSDGQLLRSLLVLERMADACVEGEFPGLRMSNEDAEEQLTAWMEREFGLPPEAV